jgi:hypothetical protein
MRFAETSRKPVLWLGWGCRKLPSRRHSTAGARIAKDELDGGSVGEELWRREQHHFLGLQFTNLSWWNTAARSSDSTTREEGGAERFGKTLASGTGVEDPGTMTCGRTDCSMTVLFT